MSEAENWKDSIVTVPAAEAVNHPKHYNLLGATCEKCGSRIECIQVVREMNFNLGNVVKYIWRAGFKDQTADIQDLEKALWYLQDEIKRRRTPSG